MGHSIKAVYGNDFDSRAYLRRFFMRTYVFPEPPLERFIRDYFQGKFQELRDVFLGAGCSGYASFIETFAKASNLSLRDLTQCLDMLDGMRKMAPPTEKLLLPYALLLILAHHKSEREIFDSLTLLKMPKTDLTQLFPIQFEGYKANLEYNVSIDFITLTRSLINALDWQGTNQDYRNEPPQMKWWLQTLRNTESRKSIEKYATRINEAFLFKD